MRVPHNIRWDVTPEQAVQIQRDLAAQIVERDETGEVRHVAGVDVGVEGEGNRIARAAVVVLRYPGLSAVDYAVARMPVTFPYIPGMLSFREIPVILRACEKITTDPDVLIADGHGRAHPRRMGLACHLGLVLERPTIGCAKSLLTGRAADPGNQVGEWTRLADRGELIGAVVRTRANTKPVYVSIGHLVSLDRSIELVLSCCKGYRLPETTRLAHRAADGEKIRMDVDHGRQ
jgi:deoxyribonuclease V